MGILSLNFIPLSSPLLLEFLSPHCSLYCNPSNTAWLQKEQQEAKERQRLVDLKVKELADAAVKLKEQEKAME